jgi:hypothetical protein
MDAGRWLMGADGRLFRRRRHQPTTTTITTATPALAAWNHSDWDVTKHTIRLDSHTHIFSFSLSRSLNTTLPVDSIAVVCIPTTAASPGVLHHPVGVCGWPCAHAGISMPFACARWPHRGRAQPVAGRVVHASCDASVLLVPVFISRPFTALCQGKPPCWLARPILDDSCILQA